MSSSDHQEIRAVIKFCQELGKTPAETFNLLKETSHKDRISQTTVYEWHKRFSEGQTKLEDNEGMGRKRKMRTSPTSSVEEALQVGRRATVRGLADRFGASYGTLYRILTEELHMSKVHARWIPRVLKQEECDQRVRDSRAFIRRAEQEGDMFLQRLITTDESWLYNYDPETKEQSAVWKRNGSPPPMKARVRKSGGKTIFIMFADIRGMILMHAVPKGATVNAGYYSKVLRRDLVDALRKKRPGILVEHFLLHMDNASSHTAATTQLEIGVLGFGSVQHPPYSPDLAPFDFAIFPSIKRQLKGQKFDSLTELRRAKSTIVQQYDSSWYEDIFRQWVHRHRRCVDCNGAYFEKL